MFKLIGFLMLTVSGTLSGYAVSRSIIERVKFLEQYIEFISFVETEIKYTYCEAPEIIKKYSGSDKFYMFISKCCEYTSNGTPFPSAWEKSLSAFSSDIKLSSEEIRLIKSFGLGLGSSDVDGQISHCRYHSESIKPYFESALDDKKNKSKMYGILGTCFGTIIGIIII